VQREAAGAPASAESMKVSWVEELSSTTSRPGAPAPRLSIRFKVAELLGAVPRAHVRDHIVRGDVERRVQVRGAVADVVVGAPPGQSGISGKIGAERSTAWKVRQTRSRSPPRSPGDRLWSSQDTSGSLIAAAPRPAVDQLLDRLTWSMPNPRLLTPTTSSRERKALHAGGCSSCHEPADAL